MSFLFLSFLFFLARFGSEDALGLLTSVAEEVLRGLDARRAQGVETQLGASYVEAQRENSFDSFSIKETK